MSNNIISGKGRRKKKIIDNEWTSDSESENDIPRISEINDISKANNDHSQINELTNQQINEGTPGKRVLENETNFEELRKESRKDYLQKRQESKLEELSQEISNYSSRLSSLSKSETKDYESKLKIYNIIKQREEAKIAEFSSYQLPSGGVNSEGKLDKRRKLDLLYSKNSDQKDDQVRKNRYENQWELDQLNKAKQLLVKLDEISLPNQKKYDFVFDESQFIKFDEDKPLEGDLENEDKTVGLSIKNDMLAIKQSLPVFRYRAEFLDAVEKNQVLIIVGETGSGKTTQLPQYLFEAGYSKGKNGKTLKIACTQPRRVAATSVANRVAEEMNVRLGEEVGYSIRFEDKSNDKTIIKYLTDGMLLREFLTDAELSSYSAVIIDEAHERTLSTEILLSLLKDIVKYRKDLKLIIASATINAKKFSDFFINAPIFNIPGRRYPVDIHYTKNPEANYIQAAITTIFQIHTTQELPGDILVFLTGQEEIETMEESLHDSINKLGSSIKPLIICSIYANLPTDLQSKIFEPTPPNCRKVVLATNIAETSITIDGIKYVIDPGYVKQNYFNPLTGMESLVVVPCSRASANQRAGRAGRIGPGKCFRLYTKWSFYNELDANPIPEILRANLTSIILLLLSLGINDLINFEFMDPPSSDTIIKSLELLYSLGALNSKGQLTKIGRKMAEFPIDPMFSKCLISSSKFGVTDEILSIISILGESSNLFYRPKDKREQADKRKEIFNKEEGDHLTLLNLWEQWIDNGYSNQWCEDNFVQYKTLKRIRDIRKQLENLCIRSGILIDNNEQEEISDDLRITRVQKSIVSGFFPNICRLSKMGDSYRKLKKNQPVYIHPSSSLYPVKPPPKLILYHELVLTSKEFMRNCMVINKEWIKEFGSHYYNEKELEFLDSKNELNRFMS